MNPMIPFQKESASPVIPKIKSIAKTRRANMMDATTTIIVLLCNSFQVGHVTLCTISVTVSLKYSLIFDTFYQF